MQKTDLNVTPYYDDFTEDNNFHRVLFRPAFSVQARELTQLQSILQNQIERMGSHFFKEGAMIIPGQVGFDITYSYVKIQATFTSGSTTHTVENFRTSLVGKKLTGATTDVIAKVVGTSAADGSDDLTLFVKYETAGTPSGGTTTMKFANGEALNVDTSFSYVTGGTTLTISGGNQTATVAAANATGTGSSASVQKGVYFIRGTFVQCSEQTILLDKYANSPSYRVGFVVTESLSTPEEDISLLDNATGSTNFAAKGAHRLKYTLTLTKKSIGTSDDADFVELMTLENGRPKSKVRTTEYSVLEETLARRTFDESGDYIVKGFDIDMREHLDDGLNNGLFPPPPLGIGDASKVAVTLSPGKAYIRGYEVATISQTVVPLDKARQTEFLQNYPVTFSAGNYLTVDNVYGIPDIDSASGITPFKEVEIRDQRLPVTHLTTAISANNTATIAVDNRSVFPSSGAFVIRIGNELMQVPSSNGGHGTGQGNFTNVVRGYLGTAAASAHALNSVITGWGIDPQTTSNSRANVIGVARTRAFEHGTGSASASFGNASASYHPTARFQHYIFDVRMLCKLTINSALSSTDFIHSGALITGSSSGATGIVYITPQDLVTTNVKNNAGNAVTASENGARIMGGSTIHLIQTAGTFRTGEAITSNISGDLANARTVHGTTAPVYFNMSDAHSVASVNSTPSKSYIADIHPNDVKQLTGSVTAAADSTTIKGTNTGFLSDLKVGDLIEFQDTAGVVHRSEVTQIASNTSLTVLQSTAAVTVEGSNILRVRSILEEQEELVMISKLPKFAIKSLKPASLNNLVDTTLTVRRQVTKALTGGGLNISIPEGETFPSFTADDYVVQVLEEASANPVYPAGTILAANTSGTGCTITGTGAGTQSLAISLTGGQDEVLKVIFTVEIAVANEKTKTLQPMNTLEVTNKSGNIFGTNATDEEISLNKADIFKVRAVYESADFSTTPVAPTCTYNNGQSETLSTEIFQPGEKITASNGAVARVISGGSTGATTTFSFSYLTTKTFANGVTLTSAQNQFTNTLTVEAVTAGDSDILKNFEIDDGQRDTYYDIGRISRKPGVLVPAGRLLIVFDYFTHGAGDYFSVDSYPVGTATNSITYDEIPTYSATRIDPDVIAPTGQYELRDSVDFRPRVGDFAPGTAYGSSGQTGTQLNTTSKSPFQFDSRDFSLGSSSLVDMPKTDKTFLTSFDYYLPQNGALFLDSEGEFKTVVGGAAENPEMPTPIDDAMKLASFRIPQYTFDPLDIGVRKMRNRRFTMKDIGFINQRVQNLEFFTQLNMLEKSTESFQIQDSDGLDRFKNGFVVDNFKGHGTGNASHPDYQNSMDMAIGILRPEFNTNAIELSESATTDTLRTAAGYQKTGDLLTLPYVESTIITQPFASRIENVNPFNVIAWIGTLILDPASDIWKDTKRMPNLVIERAGTYDTFLARNNGSAVNTVWNEWETFWTGEPQVFESTGWNEQTRFRAQVPARRKMVTEKATVEERQSRTGVATKAVPRLDYESKGDSVVSTEILPFCRARDVNFDGSVFKPRSRLYAFFDNVDVSQYITPKVPYINKYTAFTSVGSANIVNSATATGTINVTSTGVFPTTGKIQIDDEIMSYSNKSSTTFTISARGQDGTSAATHAVNSVVYKVPEMGDPLVTGATGKMAGTFSIPDPNISGNPAFKVGERVLRMTSDSTNATLSGDVDTAGEATYFAKGLLDNIQETIIATRNHDEHLVEVTQNRSVFSTRVSDRQIGWWDPLAQSFILDTKGGAFITSLDVYFQSKSETVPVQCQIRTMRTGYPTTTILPFGRATVEPSDVQISDDASLPTKFTFPSPVYLMQDVEYCFVIMANTQDYHVWLSHMGDVEVGGSRMISEQPYAGVLFKSQNASTWSASQMEDMKFSIRRASFSTNEGVVTLQNNAISPTTLEVNPITLIPDSKKVFVSHPNHGMYKADTNNVIIAGVPSSTVQGYDISNINGTYTQLSEVGIDHYILDLENHGGGTAPGSNFTDAVAVGGATITATQNYAMDSAKTILQIMELSGTTCKTRIRTTSGTSPSGVTGGNVPKGGGETSFTLTTLSNAKEITPNTNIEFDNPRLIASPINETSEMTGNKSFQTTLTFNTESENLSPVLDTQRMGLFAIQNRLNNIEVNSDLFSSSTLTASNADGSTPFGDRYKNSTSPAGDANSAIYITRKIGLQNSSSALKVLFDANRPSSSSIDVYWKVLRSDDTAQFEDITWTEMPLDKTVSESKNYDDYREYAYEVSGLDGFIAFAIKIVMKGTNSAEPPKLKDFRAIALAL